MEILIVACVLAAFVLAFVVVSYERELRSIARFLEGRERGSNQRVTVEYPTRGVTGVARAINTYLDEERDRRIAEEERRSAFQQDLASLSHDIRTPLAGAQGYLQLYAREQGVEERERCVREAESRLAAMRELVDQLFEYTKAADPTHAMELEAVQPYPLLAEALAGAYPDFAARGWEPCIDFEDEELWVQGNREALCRVFANLTVNALRYGSEAPTIVQRGRRVEFRNAVDNPDAIDVNRMFARFYRADAARAGGASGLGLAIVAHLCERMGAQVTARIEGDALCVSIDFAELSQDSK